MRSARPRAGRLVYRKSGTRYGSVPRESRRRESDRNQESLRLADDSRAQDHLIPHIAVDRKQGTALFRWPRLRPRGRAKNTWPSAIAPPRPSRTVIWTSHRYKWGSTPNLWTPFKTASSSNIATPALTKSVRSLRTCRTAVPTAPRPRQNLRLDLRNPGDELWKPRMCMINCRQKHC